MEFCIPPLPCDSGYNLNCRLDAPHNAYLYKKMVHERLKGAAALIRKLLLYLSSARSDLCILLGIFLGTKFYGYGLFFVFPAISSGNHEINFFSCFVVCQLTLKIIC